MMTKQNIITLPNSHLRDKSKPVKDVKDPKVIELIDDMLNVVLDWESSRKHEVAVGLAAVQVDKLIRIIIVREDFDDYRNKNFLQ